MKLDREKLEARTLEIMQELKKAEGFFSVPTHIRSTQIRGLIQALCEQLDGEAPDD